jgi:competence protein ComEC
LPPFLAVAMGAGVLLYFAGTTEPDPAWIWLPLPLMAAALLLLRRAPLAALGMGLLGAGALGFSVALWHAGRAAPVVPFVPWP